jgi:hypothetical protein
MNPPPHEPDPVTPASPDAIPAVTERGRLMPGLDLQGRLYRFGLYCTIGAIIYFLLASNTEDTVHLYLGLCIFILSVLPGLLWAKHNKDNFPVFEAFAFTFINTYATPLLTGHHQLAGYTSDVITTAATAVLLFQIVGIATYLNIRCRPKATPFWMKEIISEEYSRFLSYGMTLTTIYTVLSSFSDLIPSDLIGVLRAIFFGIGIVCTFITCRRWGAGLLPVQDKYFFALNLVVQFFILVSTLFLIAGISLLVLAALGFVSGSRRLPLIPLLVLLPLLALLHNGKGAMRAKYWDNGIRPSLTELPSFFSEWFTAGLPGSEKQDARVTAKLLERTSLFHIICLVVDRTPEHQDYLHGDTYLNIPGQLIPRYFWPGKPVGHVSTNRLSTYYGLQSEDATVRTTIAFGMLAEAYANFGFLGVGVFAFLFAGVLRLLTGWGANSPTLSYGGLLLVMLMAWSFQVELTLSVWLSSLFQGCVAILGVPLLVRSLGI